MARQVKYDFNPFALTGESAKGVRNRNALLEEIADFVVDKVKDRTAVGSSPVTDHGKFKRLSAAYASDKKGGNRLANLRLTNDMMESLVSFKLKGNTMRLTVGQDENNKADGHNNFSGNSPLPERRFIPKGPDGETFKRDIISGIRSLIKEAKE